MKLTKFLCLALVSASMGIGGCATDKNVRGVSTTSPDRQTQLTDEVPAEGSRKIPVTTTHGNY